MCIVRIKDVLALSKSLPDAGTVFYTKLNDAIASKERIVADMSGVTSLPSVFLNVSIGKIIDERGKSALHILTFVNITKGQADRLRDYLKRYN